MLVYAFSFVYGDCDSMCSAFSSSGLLRSAEQTCGLLDAQASRSPARHGAPKAKGTRLRVPFAFGASDGTRTRDLVLTKDALYLLSYTSLLRCLRPFRGRFLIIGCVFAYVNCFCLNSFYKFAMMAYNTIHSGVSLYIAAFRRRKEIDYVDYAQRVPVRARRRP